MFCCSRNLFSRNLLAVKLFFFLTENINLKCYLSWNLFFKFFSCHIFIYQQNTHPFFLQPQLSPSASPYLCRQRPQRATDANESGEKGKIYFYKIVFKLFFLIFASKEMWNCFLWVINWWMWELYWKIFSIGDEIHYLKIISLRVVIW